MALTRTSPLSRLAALGLLVLVLVVLGIGAGVPLWHDYRETVAEIKGHMRSLQVHQWNAEREATLRRSVQRLKQSRSLDGLLLPPGSDGGAVAAMQDRLQSIIGGAGARLTSTQALPAESGDGHRRVGLRLQFAADVEGLRQILHALESGRPVLVLDNLFVRGRTSRAVGAVNPLDVRVDVFALKREGA